MTRSHSHMFFFLVRVLPFNHARVDVVLLQQRSNHVEIVCELREDDDTCRRFFLEQGLQVSNETRHFSAVVLKPIFLRVLNDNDQN